ncbi:polyphosphate kinase 2 family protein [Mucisphaera sp.]|uniref:polyphosphate kinase 2 family protein n=1 Tax=Mucisphaera sp. TaxID=2913024 RepID=UPI003D148E26
MHTDSYRVTPGRKFSLSGFPTADDGGFDKDVARDRFAGLRQRLIEQQELLYADGRFGVLVVFQAMDAGGKGSTIRKVIGPLNPAGVRVTSFKAPSDEELRHDFLWRVHARAPRRGDIAVFNRSHYEDVLIARVKGLVPAEVCQQRYEHINAFERLLHDEGTRVVKFYLHISKGYQKQRLQLRLDDPNKHWKFEPADLQERARWSDYQMAFEEAISRCSTDQAPWYVVPAERRWFRNLLVAQVLVDTLDALDLRTPKPAFDPKTIDIPD